MAKKMKSKDAYKLSSVVFLIFAIVLILGVYFSKQRRAEYKKRGILLHKKLALKYKKEDFSQKAPITKYYFDIYFFPKHVVASDRCKSIDYKNPGMVTNTIYVDKDFYETKKKGDIIDFYYLPEQACSGVLTSFVEDGTSVFTYILIALFFMLSIFLGYLGFFKKQEYSFTNKDLINVDSINKILKDNFAEFITTNEGIIDMDLPYSVAGGFAHYLLECYKQSKINELKKGLDFIELLHVKGNEEVKGIATIGYIEGIQNVWSHFDVDLNVVYKDLDKESKSSWDELNDFWENKNK